MYHNLKKYFYWPLVANDVMETARICAAYAKLQGTRALTQEKLKLIPAAGPLEFIAMDILWPFPNSIHGSWYLLVITDQSTKLTWAVPLESTTAMDVAIPFLVHLIYPYRIPLYLLTDNGSQCISTFFEHLCSAVGLKQLLTTAYYPITREPIDKSKE